MIGDDQAGGNILDALEEEEVDCDGIAIIEDRITTVKTRMIAGREYLISSQQLLLRWILKTILYRV